MTVPSPDGALSRHQPLAGPEERQQSLRLPVALYDPDLPERSPQRLRCLDEIDQRQGAGRQCGIFRIVAGHAPVRRRRLFQGRIEVVTKSRAKRRLEAALDFHLLYDGRIGAAAGRLQHAPDRSRFRLDAVQPRPGLIDGQARGGFVGARLGEALFDGGDGGLGLLQRRLRKLDLLSLLVRIGESRHLTVKIVEFTPLIRKLACEASLPLGEIA